MTPKARQVAFAAALLVFGVRTGLSQAESPSDVTVLDPVFVEASTSDPWRYAAVPGFEILSRCTDGFTQDFARALARSNSARLAVLPAEFWGTLATPMKIVMYNRAPAGGDGLGARSPIDLAWSEVDSALLGSGDVANSYPLTLGDGDTFINCGNYRDLQADSAHLGADPDSEIRLRSHVPSFPAWFIEGMTGPRGVYTHHRILTQATGAVVQIPNALWTTSRETLEIQAESKKDPPVHALRPLLPLSQLFSRNFPEDEAPLWQAECGLLVRWGLFKSGNRQAFLEFVNACTREPPSEALFERSFGITAGQALDRLQGYLPEAASETLMLPATVDAQPGVPLRDARPTEVARILGDWGRFEGNSGSMEELDYQRECMDQSERLFERNARRKASDPLFLAAYGLFLEKAGNDTEAESVLGEAVAAGVNRPRAYTELARLVLEQQLATLPRGIGDLSPAQFERILGLLQTARSQMPSLPATYFLFCRAFEHAPEKPRRADLGVLDDAVRVLPQDSELAYRVATTFRRLGFSEDARAVVARATGFAESERARRLLASTGTRE